MSLPEFPPTVTHLPRWVGIGLEIPERRADCSGQRPSWYPFQMNVCDVDAPDPEPFSGRQLEVPPAPVPPWVYP